MLPVSDWVCAVQCQHGTSGDCVQQQKGCTNRLQIRFARFGRHFGSARHGNADPPAAGARGVHGVDSGWSGVCAWFCVILSVLPVSDWVCAVQCQHGTSGDCVQQQKGCTNRLQIRFARFGRHFGSARHGNADPPAAVARSVHGVDSGWSGVCAWFCVILSVLPVSDWVCAVQCQHGTSGDCVQQQKGCTNRLQIRFARFGRHFGSDRHGNADPPPARGPGRARCRLGVERCVCVVLCYFECAACFRLGLRCPVSAWHLW